MFTSLFILFIHVRCNPDVAPCREKAEVFFLKCHVGELSIFIDDYIYILCRCIILYVIHCDYDDDDYDDDDDCKCGATSGLDGNIVPLKILWTTVSSSHWTSRARVYSARDPIKIPCLDPYLYNLYMCIPLYIIHSSYENQDPQTLWRTPNSPAGPPVQVSHLAEPAFHSTTRSDFSERVPLTGESGGPSCPRGWGKTSNSGAWTWFNYV